MFGQAVQGIRAVMRVRVTVIMRWRQSNRGKLRPESGLPRLKSNADIDLGVRLYFNRSIFLVSE